MNKHDTRHVAEARDALATRTDLTPHERRVIENEIKMYKAGTLQSGEYETFDARIHRLRDHYP